MTIDDLETIRADEARHFRLIAEAIESLGGDPTSQTPSADLAGVESMGLVQVLNDPRTSIAQSLHWLDDVIPSIDPAAAPAASATKPPLVPFETSSHRGGGGPKRDRALQEPFRDRLRHQIVNGLAATGLSPAL